MPDKCMISVNEVWLPNPSGLEVAYTVMDKYALRDINYKLHREIAAKKIKYTLNWNYIPDSAEFAALWDLLAGLPEYVTITAPHPNGTMHTFEGYLGADMGVTMRSYWDMGEGRMSTWQSLQASLIER